MCEFNELGELHSLLLELLIDFDKLCKGGRRLITIFDP